MGAKILLVEDDPRMVRLVSEVLKAVGHQVVASTNGPRAIEMVAMEQPSLVLLDVLLAGEMDGFAVCQRVREFSDVPIIMLTARARESDVLTGFDAGADDYLTKPFSSRELVARVKAVLKRAERPEEITTETFACRALEIDFARRLVKVHGSPVALTPTEYRLLLELAKNANCVLLHRDLLTRVWGPEYRDDIDYLRAYIRHLRRKLEPDPANPCYIITHPGVGYMLECDPQ